MKSRSIQAFLNLFKSGEALTVKAIAEDLHCSEKTVRNYIQEVNLSGPVLLYENNAYHFNPAVDFAEIEKRMSAMTPADAQLQIIKTLLQTTAGISENELLDDLCVSAKTLDKYISEINRQISSYRLSVGRKKGQIILKGSESDKRELFKQNLRINDYSYIEKDLTSICNASGIDYLKLKQILHRCLDHHDIYVNDYSFLNILTHLVVNLVRISNGYELIKPQNGTEPHEGRELDCSKDIIDAVNDSFGISIADEEAEQLALLISSKTITTELSVFDSNQAIHNDVSRDFILKTIDAVEEHFGISLYDEEFIYFFMLHVSGLIERSKIGHYSSNPLFEEVLNSDSFVYEIAVFISSMIIDQYKINIPNEEIAFLAFHIGSIIVKKNLFAEEISIAVCSYDFYRYFDLLKDRLDKLSSNSIRISYIDKNGLTPIFTYDLLIHTGLSDISSISCQETLKISPIINDESFETIRNRISRISQEKKKRKIWSYLDQFFSYDLFEKNVYFQKKEDYIHYMSDKLHRSNVVDETFEEAVLERERLTATSFDSGIAIPHAIKGTARINHAFVIINDRPVSWGDYEVSIIIMIALNDSGYRGFKYIMDALLDKVATKKDIERLKKCEDFISFMSLMKDI